MELAVAIALVAGEVVAHGSFCCRSERAIVALVVAPYGTHRVTQEIRIAHMVDAFIVHQRIAHGIFKAGARGGEMDARLLLPVDATRKAFHQLSHKHDT